MYVFSSHTFFSFLDPHLLSSLWQMPFLPVSLKKNKTKGTFTITHHIGQCQCSHFYHNYKKGAKTLFLVHRLNSQNIFQLQYQHSRNWGYSLSYIMSYMPVLYQKSKTNKQHTHTHPHTGAHPHNALITSNWLTLLNFFTLVQATLSSHMNYSGHLVTFLLTLAQFSLFPTQQPEWFC